MCVSLSHTHITDPSIILVYAELRVLYVCVSLTHTYNRPVYHTRIRRPQISMRNRLMQEICMNQFILDTKTTDEKLKYIKYLLLSNGCATTFVVPKYGSYIMIYMYMYRNMSEIYQILAIE